MALHQTEVIELQHLPAEITASKATEPFIREKTDRISFITIEELEQKYIREVLNYTGGNKTRAAKILGIHPTSLFRKIKKSK